MNHRTARHRHYTLTDVLVLLAIAFAAAFFAPTSHAQTPTLTISATWTNPTTTTDGLVLPSTAITKTRLEYGSAGTSGGTCSFGTKIADVNIAGNAQTGQIPGLPVAKYAVRAYTTANGIESGPSNIACTNAPPNAPGGLSLSIAINVSIGAGP